MDTWTKSLITIAEKLNEHGIEYILVASGALKILGVNVTPKDIDIFTTKDYLKKCHQIFKDIATTEIYDFTDETGTYLEFQAMLNNIPIEFCELENMDRENTMKVSVNNIEIPIPKNTINEELEKHTKLGHDTTVGLIKDYIDHKVVV